MERRIRHLEQEIKTKNSRYEAARSHRKLMDKRCYDLELEILELKEQVSSLPSSALPFRKKVPNSRKPTGKRLHASFPPGIVNDVTYGASIKALAFLLNNYYNVSIAKTKQCISDVTKGIVNLSTGTICNLSDQFSSATKADRAKIFSLLTHSDVLYSDATFTNINGNRKAVILFTDKKQAVVLRSTSGRQRICDALTIIETARMQHKNVYDTVETAFVK